MRIIIAGAGGTSRDLLRRLGDVWEATVIDPDPDRLLMAAKVRPIDPIPGDASSAVVLRRAGLGTADAFVAATSDDAVNLEACRLAVEAGVLRVQAAAADSEGLDAYRQLGVNTYSGDRLAARKIEAELDPRRVASAEFADGKAEAIEFRISADSPVRGRKLRELPLGNWVVAAILRAGVFVAPHGDTTVETDDRVTVVGASSDYAMIVRTFTSGEARFPLDFGKKVAVALAGRADLEGPVREAVTVARASRAAGVIVVYSALAGDEQSQDQQVLLAEVDKLAQGVDVSTRPVAEPPSRALLHLPGSESVGVLVFPVPTGGELVGRRRIAKMLRAIRRLRVPTLFSRGTHPYRRIVVPARDTGPGWAAATAAIDLAAQTKAILVGVAVVPPVFVAGDRKQEATQAVARLREEAAVQNVRVRRHVRRGNPVRVIEEFAAEADLTVLGLPGYDPTFLTPGVVGHLVRRLRTSVLLVPPSA